MYQRILGSFVGAMVAILCATAAARADSVAVVTSLGGLSANDTIVWSPQLGVDAAVLSATPSFTSTHGINGSVTLTGPNSLIAVVCPEAQCSWNPLSTTGFAAGDGLIWTADTGNSGNGPLSLSFTTKNVAGAGAFIQADGPAQFTATIQAFDSGMASLGGPFNVMSDVAGDATFIGILDSTNPNIHAVTFSITSCTGDCTDFAIDTVSLNVPPGGPTATPTATATGATATATPTATATQTATPTATATPVGTLSFKPTSLNFGNGTPMGKASKAKKLTIRNTSSKSSRISVMVTGESAPLPFMVKTQCLKTLMPGKTCKVSVAFMPADTSPHANQLMINDSATGNPHMIPLNGTGK